MAWLIGFNRSQLRHHSTFSLNLGVGHRTGTPRIRHRAAGTIRVPSHLCPFEPLLLTKSAPLFTPSVSVSPKSNRAI